MCDTTKELAEQIVSVVLHDLQGRSGFDAWWDSIAPENKEVVYNDLAYKVNTQLLMEEN